MQSVDQEQQEVTEDTNDEDIFAPTADKSGKRKVKTSIWHVLCTINDFFEKRFYEKRIFTSNSKLLQYNFTRTCSCNDLVIFDEKTYYFLTLFKFSS